MITVIDYGMGNLGSIMNILRRIGAEATLTSNPAEIGRADALVLPGVGAFDRGMERLHTLGLVEPMNERVLGSGTPILGICLGVQLFTEGSEEGQAPGLGWIAGRTRRFRFEGVPNGLRIPHMGWNTITPTRHHPLFDNMADDARFYFVHSYHVCCDRAEDVLATTHYGLEFTSAVARGEIVGVQFHPEKSLRWGMAIFRNFVSHVGTAQELSSRQ